MASSFPGGLDAFTNPTSGDNLNTSVGGRTHSQMHRDENDAIEAVQAELGTNPSAAFASVAARFDAAEADIAQVSERVFHVDDFGAVGNGTTDDTTAILAAFAACATAGGGTVQFGPKTYLANGSLSTAANGYAVLPLPTGRQPIRLRGVAPANNCDPLTDSGKYSIIKTTKTGLTRHVTNGVPSLIGGPTDSTWLESVVAIENLCLWLPKNPTIAGIDLRHARRCLIDGVNVQAINTGDSTYTQPTSVYAFGLRTPEPQNYNTVLIRSGQAHGMYAGLVGSTESLTASYWCSKWCTIGWAPMPGGHGGVALKMALEWNTYHVSGWSETGGVGSVATGPNGETSAQVSVSYLAIEDAPASNWYSTTAHVNDSSNRIKGVAYFDRYDGTGPSSSLTKTGGTGLTAISLLSPSFSTGAALTVQDENTNVSTTVTQIDFQGSGVTTTSGTGEVIVTIPGASAATQYTKRDRLTATAGNDTLTLGATPIEDSVLIWVDNVIKWPGVNYTRSGAVVTFLSSLSASQVVMSSYETTNGSASAAALSTAAVTPTYPTRVATLTPLAYWKLDDTSGSLSSLPGWADSSGNARHMTLGSLASPGQTSLLVNGTGTSTLFDSAAYTAISSAAWMETDYVSVCMRYKPRTADLTGSKPLISRWLNQGGPGYTFYFSLVAGKLTLELNANSGAAMTALSGATTLVASTTYTIGFTWDGTTAKVYLDGASDGSKAYSGVLKKSSGSSIDLARVASAAGGSGGGYYDEVALFGTALSSTDMANLHASAIVT